MAFPFYPMGLIAAAAVLAGTLAVFRLLLLVLDRGAAELRGSIGPGLVRGVRAWTAEHDQPGDGGRPGSPPPRSARQPASLSRGASLEELAAPPDVATEAVHQGRH